MPTRVICVKRALAKLKVAADWRAPVERNHWEVEWMRVAAGIVPAAVPAILGEDPEAGAFAMEWLPPERYPVWKSLLAEGRGTTALAASVGATLGRIHAATADRPDLAARFATDANFHAIRLDPYLLATARAHPDLADRLEALVATTAATQRVLVHGDFSPKNILQGPDGPVILDAECAWYGDPAFDLAFVLNHLLLKGVWRPQWRQRLRGDVPTRSWPRTSTTCCGSRGRGAAPPAALLPGLLLARVDGKSPVEYVTADAERDAIRAFARPRVLAPPASLETLVKDWAP